MTRRKRSDAQATAEPEGASPAAELTRHHTLPDTPVSTPLPTRPKPASRRAYALAAAAPPRNGRAGADAGADTAAPVGAVGLRPHPHPHPRPRPRPVSPRRGAAPATGGPAEAFDALHTAHAVGLVRQAYLLTGRRQLAHRAVERAFHQAWQRWPEVARDSDPAGWVRAAAYEYALSPWRQLHPGNRRPPTEPGADPTLIAALLRLPDSYRRALLLYDGVGLGLPETAAETEASTMATAGRLTNARAALAETLPELAGAPPARRGEVLHRMLGELAAAQPVRTEPAASVRTGSERRTRLWTRGALGLTALLAAVTAFAAVGSGPDRHNPPQAPGEPGATASPAAVSHAEGPSAAEPR